MREKILRDAGYSGTLVEEYVIVCLAAADTGPAPDNFVGANRLALAALLRSQTLSETDAEQTLISRARYSDHDLTIVDWEGAVIIDSEEDFQSEIVMRFPRG